MGIAMRVITQQVVNGETNQDDYLMTLFLTSVYLWRRRPAGKMDGTSFCLESCLFHFERLLSRDTTLWHSLSFIHSRQGWQLLMVRLK